MQSAALRLLFNYKLDYIRPYEEHLMKLLDETEMWNTLAEIEFGAANPVIQECHRNRLVPLIIRWAIEEEISLTKFFKLEFFFQNTFWTDAGEK